MCQDRKDKSLAWVGSSRKDLRAMPEAVQRKMGAALREAQHGGKSADAKPMKGNLRDVMEIVDDDEAGTFRVMYTATIGDVVYVLAAFQKKSKTGIETSRADRDRVLWRLKRAREEHEKERKR
jgi:phage-related protein